MSPKDVQIVERETLYDGFFRLRRYALRHRRFDGDWSPVLRREVFERGSVAAVLPYDPWRDTVVLIEQFRMGPLAAGVGTPWLVEIVAGIVEPGETPEHMVRREALEETGCRIDTLEHITTFFPSPGGSSELCHLYCGRVDSTNAGGLHGNRDEGEDIRAFVEDAAEAIDRATGASVRNAISIIALQWLALHREDLRRRWS